jgi:hypothetical protein
VTGGRSGRRHVIRRACPALRAGRASDVEGVHAGGAQAREVVETQAPADHQALGVAGVAAPRGLAQQHREPVVDPVRRTRRQVRVQTRQVGELLAQGFPVGGAVDGPVERPRPPVQLGDHPLHRVQIGPAVLPQEPEHELLRPGRPQLARHPYQGVHAPRREPVGEPQHDPYGNVDGGPHLHEGRDGRGESVGPHVRDQLQPVGTTGLGGDGVLGVEGDHLQKRARGHGAPSVGLRLQVTTTGLIQQV